MSVNSVKEDLFLQLAIDNQFDEQRILSAILDLHPTYKGTLLTIQSRIANLANKGLIPLESGNKVAFGQVLKATSTLHREDGTIALQWVKSDVPKEAQVNAIKEAIESIASDIPPLPPITKYSNPNTSDLLTIYISNDLHLGELIWSKETGKDWDLPTAIETVQDAFVNLISSTPPSSICILTDLGDLMTVDSFDNRTVKSGNIISIDSRYPKILRAAYTSLVVGIQLALTKHDQVIFTNVAGKRLPSPTAM